MFCCDGCKDRIIIPKGAIEAGGEEVIVQSFPLLCNNVLPDNYKPICVKEYYTRRKHLFNKHVRIVSYFRTKLANHTQIRVRYSAPNGVYNQAVFVTKFSRGTFQPDVYFKIRGKKLIIFTNHFTLFSIESLDPLCNNCSTQRSVDLVVHAYFSRDYEDKSVDLRVYIRDIADTDNSFVLKQATENKEIKEGQKQRCLDDERLKNLPLIITEKTTFQCIVILLKSQWQILYSTLVRFNVQVK